MLARKIILGFGFAILMPMLIHYGIDVFAPMPDYRSSAGEETRLHRQIGQAKEDKDRVAEEAARRQLEAIGAQRRANQEQSSRIHFFVGAPLGILLTLAGSFVRAQAIGGGLMLGGIFTFTGGCFWYWGDLSRQGRFGVLLVAFLVLLWIGYQRLSELKQPAKPT